MNVIYYTIFSHKVFDERSDEINERYNEFDEISGEYFPS